MKVDEFKFLGSTIQSKRQCIRELKKRVQGGWSGWRQVCGGICDRTAARLKGNVYKMVVRIAVMYGLEMLVLTKRQEAELKMFRF